MADRDAAILLREVVAACDLIARFLDGVTFAAYEADDKLRSAVERQLEIVGEAIRVALVIEPALAEDISQPRRAVALRNRLAHGYASISDAIVWGVATSSLPRLREEVLAILERRSEQGRPPSG